MKATAEKSSATTSRTHSQTPSRPFFGKAGEGGFFESASHLSLSGIQFKMKVGQPGDTFEREADRMADKVMRMPNPASPLKEEKLQRQADDKLQKKEDEKIQKAPAPEEKLQRKGDGAPAVAASTQSAIQHHTTGGQPLSSDVRSYMEPRFGANFSNVRVHTDPESASISDQLSARAFTYQNHVFFSGNQYQPGTSAGKQLLAHELTHTIQQGHAVQRSPHVSTTTTPPPIQRAFSLPDIDIPNPIEYFTNKVTDFVKQHAEELPGFTMLTVVMGKNPITGAAVDRSAGNILRGAIQMLPGVGNYITQALDKHGVFNKVSVWAEQQFNTMKDIGGNIWQDIKNFIKTFSLIDLKDPGGIWSKAKAIVMGPINQIKSFASGLVSGIGALIKEAILKPIAAFAKANAPNGYDLLSAVLGYDPISGDPVPQTAENLIGPFMKLIGQEDVWQNMQKANAVSRAFAWFKGAVGAVKGFVTQIPGLFVAAFKSLEIMDIILLSNAFNKVKSVFGGFIESFISWAGTAVWNLLEIIFAAVAPGVIGYLKKAAGAFRTILKDPIGFVGNLVRAGKLGFEMFAGNILNHLKTALIKWITGPLGEAGVYIPKSFSLIEIVKLVLSVLGLTWQNIRSKLVKIIPEPILVGLEKTAGILVTLVKDGPAAAWEQIKTELSELKDQLISQVTQMVTTEVVKAAVTKLVSMLNPAGAIIQAILAIYNTVTFFIDKAKQIGAVVASFIDSISAIAAGQVAGAAKRVEQTMASTLVVVIGFLAKFAGLGNIPEKLVGVVKKIRQPIDKGLDKIVAWLGKMLKKAGGAIAQAGLPADPKERLKLGMQAAVAAVNRFAGRSVSKVVLNPVLSGIKLRYGFSALELMATGKTWTIHGTVNPTTSISTDALAEDTVEHNLSEAELMDMLLGTSAPIRELEAEQVPSTRLSESSSTYSVKVIAHLIISSPAPQAQKDHALDLLIEKAQVAIQTQDSHEIYRALVQAAGRLKGLYKTDESVLQIHHEQEVSKHPETFAKTAHERLKLPKKLQAQLDQSIKRIAQKYKALSGKTKKEKKELAKNDIEELRELVKQSLVDWKRSRVPDEKGRRSQTGEPATAPAKSLEEIDLIALTVRAHISVHRQRKQAGV